MVSYTVKGIARNSLGDHAEETHNNSNLCSSKENTHSIVAKQLRIGFL